MCSSIEGKNIKISNGFLSFDLENLIILDKNKNKNQSVYLTQNTTITLIIESLQTLYTIDIFLCLISVIMAIYIFVF